MFRMLASLALFIYVCQAQENGGDPFFGGDMNDFMQPPATEPEPPSDAVLSAIESCGEVIDAHLHESLFFSTADALISEMDRGSVSRGVLMAVYGAKPSPFSDDPNTSVQQFAEESGGRIYGLVSLNTTTRNWRQRTGSTRYIFGEARSGGCQGCTAPYVPRAGQSNHAGYC